MASAAQADPDTPITVKVSLDGHPRRFKLALRDVGIHVLETKLRNALNMPADTEAVFERYSDSGSAYVLLDQANVAVYKQLYRAAKAKHKLKLRVTVKHRESEEEEHGPKPASVTDEPEEETQPSVGPTDAECEPEQPATSDPSLGEATIPTGLSQGHESDIITPAVAPATSSSSSSSTNAEPEVDSELARITEMLADIATSPPAPQEAPATVQPDAPAPAPESPCNVECPAIHTNYAVCCNSCDQTIPDAHYHCSTCDDGDFDLCQTCVNQGVTCKGSNHWLIKRFVKSGVIINSTTERLGPKPKPKKPVQLGTVPSAERIIPVFNDNVYPSMRTCNCCVRELPEAEFAHCTSCEDFDLCRSCFAKNRHGHHPKHAFVPAVEGTRFDHEVARRLPAGRGQTHNAICDGCDKGVQGVRHKCLECPDWDYCSDCVVNAGFIHPGHRFVPVYEPLEYDGGVRIRTMNRPVHFGICCDGPLCSSARTNSTYIVGDRFKCAVCDDTDFCASCEASPANSHNRTHPLIKFKSPVRHVSVTTTGENLNGRQMPVMGDRPRARSPVPSTQASANSVPSSPHDILSTGVNVAIAKEETSARASKIDQVTFNPAPAKEEKTEEKRVSAKDLVATFVRDTVQDGTVFGLDHVFEQTWILRNSGNVAWPAGCSVKFVGGDYMGHLDSNHPAATRDVEFSCESTICYASIQPGEEFPFTVLLRTPSRTGRMVSNWRLTTKEGDRFGHRLWCDVVVEKPKVVLPPPTTPKSTIKKDDKPKPEVRPEPEPEIKPEPEVKPEPEAEPEHSQMIFPKLEKESPVASVHEESKTESVSAQEDQYEDCEDSEWVGSEDAFLTDEEYDILDASDEEFNFGGSHSQKK
jgi:next-to-BRCA1 protein 1